LDLYLVKTGGVPEFQGNLHTRIGSAVEPLIKALFAEQMAKDISDPTPSMMRSTAKPFLLATCDAFLGPEESLECKWTSYGGAWGEQSTDAIPEETILQTQQQMYVTGRKRVWVAVLVEARFRVYIVDRENDLIDWMVGQEGVFWDRVLDRDPPAVDFEHRNALGAVQALYRGQIEPVAIRLSARGEQLRQRLIGLREAEAAIAKELDSIKAEILSEMGPAEFALGPDGGGLKREHRNGYEYQAKVPESVILKRVANLPKRMILKGAPDAGNNRLD
jgi:hypothetical protein